MPISVNRYLFSYVRYSSLFILAVTFLLPSFFANMALTIFTSWESDGFTAMKRSASAAPASLRVRMADGLPSTVITSVLDARASSLPWSESMTVMSLASLLSIFARWEPTSPAPEMIIFILSKIILYKNPLS